MDRGSTYWDSVLQEQLDNPQPTWRAFIDAMHQALIARWLSGAEPCRLLKTDLYEEVVGDGLLPVIQQRDAFAVGMDVSPSLVREAGRRQNRFHCLAADSRRLPFAGGSFDGILSISTLDHFPSGEDIERSLSEFARVLRPNGILALTLDNPQNPIIALRQVLPFELLNRLGIVPYYIGCTCGPKKLRGLLDRAGFEIVEITAVVHSPRFLVIPLAAWLDRRGTVESRARLNRLLRRCEGMASWPTRFVTGHFIAVKAVRRSHDPAVRIYHAAGK